MIRLPRDYSCPVILGSGEYSTVYRAYHSRLDRFTAVKVFKNLNIEISRKICEEARILAGVKLTCIPQVYDVIFEKRSATLIMEWIHGVPLNRFISVETDPMLRRMVAKRIVQALAMLHQNGIAHRDLKPENIIISSEGAVLLVDFGFAVEKKSPSFKSGKIMGTPRYMAPELWCCSDNIDYRKSDLYSLGIILEEITGKKTFADTADILDPDPSKRPGDACKLLSEMDVSDDDLSLQQKLTRSVSLITSEYLAQKYLESAEKLLSGNQIKEAYQVIAEILEEAPDHTEAVSLLHTIQYKKKASKTRVGVIIAACTSILFLFLILIAFELGRKIQNGSNTPFIYESSNAQDSFIVPKSLPIRSMLVSNEPALKNDLGISSVNGELICVIPSSSGFLQVDTAVFKRCKTNPNEISLSLAQGNHIVEWVDSISDRRITENLRVLPFEKKKIKLSFAKGEVE